MDRGIACRVRLVGQSQAFKVTVTPDEGFNSVQPGRRYAYHVTLTVNPGVRSGNYPVTFRLVGNDTRGQLRELTSVTIGAGSGRQPAAKAPTGPAQPGAAPGAGGKLSATVRRWSETAKPALDGKLTEWMGTSPLGQLMADGGKRPALSARVLARCDDSNLYLVFYCTVTKPKDAPDCMTVFLAKPDQPTRKLAVSLSSDGTLAVEQWEAEAKTTQDAAALGIQSAVGMTTTIPPSWVGELKIPSAALGQEKFEKGDKWLVNCVRDCKGDVAEVTFLTGTLETCRDAASFAELSFAP